MHTFVAASLLALSPSPLDLHAAAVDLHAPPETPGYLAPGFRSRVAVLIVMESVGALDPGAGGIWFNGCPWPTELDHARRVVAAVLSCPELADCTWVPPASWFAERADWLGGEAAAWNRLADEHEARVVWEPDREAALWERVRLMRAEACRLGVEADRYRTASTGSWMRPRRVILSELRAAVGEDVWRSRRWPAGW